MEALLRDPCCLLGLSAVGIGGLAWMGSAVLGLVRARIQRTRLVEERGTEEAR